MKTKLIVKVSRHFSPFLLILSGLISPTFGQQAFVQPPILIDQLAKEKEGDIQAIQESLGPLYENLFTQFQITILELIKKKTLLEEQDDKFKEVVIALQEVRKEAKGQFYTQSMERNKQRRQPQQVVIGNQIRINARPNQTSQSDIIAREIRKKLVPKLDKKMGEIALEFFRKRQQERIKAKFLYFIGLLDSNVGFTSSQRAAILDSVVLHINKNSSEIDEIEKLDIHKFVFENLPQNLSPYQKERLQKVKSSSRHWNINIQAQLGNAFFLFQ